MTTGQIIFFSGVALLVLTIIMVIIFIIRKPKYIPGNAIYSETDKGTQKLRNGYPTDRLTIRREPVRSINPDTAVLSEETARLTAEQTEKLIGTAVLPGPETEKLQEGTAPLPGGTAKLQQTEGTVQLHAQGGTAVLSERTARLSEEQTEKLVAPEDLPGQEFVSHPEETMPLEDGTVKLQQTEETAQLLGQVGAAKSGTARLDSSEEEHKI